MAIDLMWGIGAIVGWYGCNYVYNHFIAPAISGMVLTSTTDPSMAFEPAQGG